MVQHAGSTPGQDGLCELSEGEGEQDGRVLEIVAFKTLPYFLVRRDDYIQVFQISHENEIAEKKQVCFNKYIR